MGKPNPDLSGNPATYAGSAPSEVKHFSNWRKKEQPARQIRSGGNDEVGQGRAGRHGANAGKMPVPEFTLR